MGWIGTALLLVGTIQLGRKVRSGWLWSTAGTLLWLAQGIETRQLDLVFTECIFTALNLAAYLSWGGRRNAHT